MNPLSKLATWWRARRIRAAMTLLQAFAAEKMQQQAQQRSDAPPLPHGALPGIAPKPDCKCGLCRGTMKPEDCLRLLPPTAAAVDAGIAAVSAGQFTFAVLPIEAVSPRGMNCVHVIVASDAVFRSHIHSTLLEVARAAK